MTVSQSPVARNTDYLLFSLAIFCSLFLLVKSIRRQVNAVMIGSVNPVFPFFFRVFHLVRFQSFQYLLTRYLQKHNILANHSPESIFDGSCRCLPQSLSQELERFCKTLTFLCNCKTESLGCQTNRWTSLNLTFTAMPLRSVDAEAAVGVLLGTVLVLVSLR